MNYSQTLTKLIERHDLPFDEMRELMQHIMGGQLTPAQIAAVLIALRVKGETVSEIAAAAAVMRELSSKVSVKNTGHLIDTCGTGGDGIQTFNISTTSAMVAAAAGAHVAKHGGRSVSSTCGSADVLEKLGVNVSLTAGQVAQCVDSIGVGFMFAPNHHSAMKQLAQVLGELGSRHVLVVHGADGMDEISISEGTYIAELKDGKVSEYVVHPNHFGLASAPLELLRVANADEACEKLLGVLNNETGAPRDIVQLNAGAAIYVAGLTATLKEGVAKADQVIASGAAKIKLEQLIALSNRLA